MRAVSVFSAFLISALAALTGQGVPPVAAAQAPVSVAPADDLQAAIAKLGDLDYSTRMNAARVVRRAPAPQAAGALTVAVRDSDDQFVRFRALILLTGFADRTTADLMRSLVSDRNDRIREVVYRWLAVRPQPVLAPTLLAALQTEQAEFVRPALVKALAAVGTDPTVQRALIGEVARGQDFFRLGVIDALGEFKATYARDAITEVAKIDGPLQDDAVLSLGRIGDRSSEAFLATLTTNSSEVTTALQAARCLLGSDCETRVRAIADVMATPGARAEAVRAAVTALAVLGASGSDLALSTLLDFSGAARTQDAATVAFGGAALRNPDRLLNWLTQLPAPTRPQVIEILRSAFERFEEDFSEEQFFAAARAAYWRVSEGSPDRDLIASLIQKLEF
ncbi:MAG: HEAT repeat domain-containing protein [Vicinamibacterales bacterium]